MHGQASSPQCFAFFLVMMNTVLQYSSLVCGWTTSFNLIAKARVGIVIHRESVLLPYTVLCWCMSMYSFTWSHILLYCITRKEIGLRHNWYCLLRSICTCNRKNNSDLRCNCHAIVPRSTMCIVYIYMVILMFMGPHCVWTGIQYPLMLNVMKWMAIACLMTRGYKITGNNPPARVFKEKFAPKKGRIIQNGGFIYKWSHSCQS